MEFELVSWLICAWLEMEFGWFMAIQIFLIFEVCQCMICFSKLLFYLEFVFILN